MGLDGENKVIAKNTVFLYIRMFVILTMGLLTSRLVLKNLGVDDYGLYSVVGGIIAMFGFVTGAMTNTTSRFITFYLGKNDLKRLKEVFSMAIYVHVAIALVVVVLAETIGLWYVYHKLVVPEGRFDTALIIYQLSIAIAVVSILYTPFNSVIVAHEKMNTYAVISIIDASLKLLVAFMIAYSQSDKLILYTSLILAISILDLLIYAGYCKIHMQETSLIFFWDRRLFKDMFGFAGWSLFGNFSCLFYSQGVNLILNFFFGTAVNAARGLALQVESVSRQFASSIQTALNPQIIKSYADNRIGRMYSLIFASSRYCYYLLLLLAIPVVLEAEFLLDLWLDVVPDHAVNFVRITMCMIVLDGLSNPLFTASLASGKVKLYQITLSLISYTLMPVTYFALKLTMVPEIVFYCLFTCRILEQIARIFVAKKQIGMSIREYLHSVMVPDFIVTLISVILPLLFFFSQPEGIKRFLIILPVSILSVLVTVYCLGTTRSERGVINEKVVLILSRRTKKAQ